MDVNLDLLKSQLTQAEEEFKQIERTIYRLDGAIQTLKHLISEAEKPASQPQE